AVQTPLVWNIDLHWWSVFDACDRDYMAAMSRRVVFRNRSLAAIHVDYHWPAAIFLEGHSQVLRRVDLDKRMLLTGQLLHEVCNFSINKATECLTISILVQKPPCSICSVVE